MMTAISPPLTPENELNELRRATVLGGVEMAFEGRADVVVHPMGHSDMMRVRDQQTKFASDARMRHAWEAIYRRSALSYGTQPFVVMTPDHVQVLMAFQIRLDRPISRSAVTHMERFSVTPTVVGAADVVQASLAVAALARDIFDPAHPIAAGVNHPANEKIKDHYLNIGIQLDMAPTFDPKNGKLTYCYF